MLAPSHHKGSGATSRPNATWPPCYVTARRGAPDSQCGCAAYQPLAIRAVLGSVDNGSPPRCRVDVEGAIVCPISTTVHVERNPGFVHSRGPATYSCARAMRLLPCAPEVDALAHATCADHSPACRPCRCTSRTRRHARSSARIRRSGRPPSPRSSHRDGWRE